VTYFFGIMSEKDREKKREKERERERESASRREHSVFFKKIKYCTWVKRDL